MTHYPPVIVMIVWRRCKVVPIFLWWLVGETKKQHLPYVEGAVYIMGTEPFF